MNPELDRKLRHLRLSGMIQALPARNQEAIHHPLAAIPGVLLSLPIIFLA